MEGVTKLFKFMVDNKAKLAEQCLEHVGLTFIALALAIIIAVPVGIFISRKEKIASMVLGFAGVLQTIPSIALLGFMIPLLGIGFQPAIFALFLYALLPILRNTYTGIRSVEPSVREAAKGMGMTPGQVLKDVELPLSLPVIFAGIRTATVINVGIATLAAYIGAGGLGEFIFGGIALNNTVMIIAGALPAAVLAILFDQLLSLLQNLRRMKVTNMSILFAVSIPVLSSFYFLPNIYTSGIKAGFTPEFMGRDDGYKSLRQQYNLNFNTVVLGSALMYKAVREKEVDVISGYSTDGRIKAFNLTILEDNRHAFPPYHCTPIIRSEAAKRYPQAVDVLNLLAGKINDSTMTALNYQVDYLKKAPVQVAKEFLESLKLWRPDQTKGGDVLIIGSKMFTEQYLLTEIFAQLINGHTQLDVTTKPGLGGTKICFDALEQGSIDIYPEYTGTGLQVLLSPPDTLVRQLITDADAVYNYVRKRFKEDYGILWLQPLGFNNTYALMARGAEAEKNDWQNVSDLTSEL